MIDLRAASPLSRVTGAMAALALVVGLGLAAPARAQVQSTAVSVNTFTPRRIVASTAAIAGLIGAVIGGLAMARSRRAG